MKDGPLQIAKDLDRIKDVIDVLTEAGLRIAIPAVRKQIDRRLFSLGLLRQSGVDSEVAITYEPADCRDDQEQY